MKSTIQSTALVAVLFPCWSLILGSCKRPPEPPPVSFVQLISRADRATVTNLYLPVRFTLTENELRRLSTAVTNAVRDRSHYDAMFDWEVVFCQGTNALTVIHFQDRAFLAVGAQYSDNSGTLKALYDKWVKAAEPK